jgi:putative transposase
MSEYQHKSHNISVLIYHIVCPAKYRRVVFDTEVDTVLKEVCLEIAQRDEIVFLEIGTDKTMYIFLCNPSPAIAQPKLSRCVKG